MVKAHFWKSKLLERRRLRKEAGCLKDLVVTGRTLNRYKAAVSRFFNWLPTESLSQISSLSGFDMTVSTYLEFLWETGESKAWANDLCSGLQHFVPALKGHLNGSWRLLKAWGKVEIPNRACPMTLEIFQAFAGLALKEADLSTALAYCLCFQGLLRPSEAFSLVPKFVEFHPSLCSAVLSLISSKSFTRSGDREQVIIDDPLVLILLTLWKSSNTKGLPLILKQANFRAIFNRHVCSLGFAPSHYKPYSLRRGGATLLFKVTQSYDHVAQRGRWLHTRTAKIYINEAQAELAAQKLTPAQKASIRRHAAFFLSYTV